MISGLQRGKAFRILGRRPKKRLDAVVDYHLGLHARQSIGVEGSEYVEKKSRRLFSTMIILCKMKDESNIYRSINTPH